MSLLQMPVELLNEILMQLRKNAPSDLLLVALASRRLYVLAMPLIYQSVHIDISEYTYPCHLTESRRPTNQSLRTLIARLSAGPSVRALIRNIHVFGRNGFHTDILELLQCWLAELGQLVSFSWDVDGFFPTILLETLAQHSPKIHLHMRTDISNFDVRREWKVLRLAPNMLRSLQVCMPNDESQSGRQKARQAKEKLFWALKYCPGLQSLSTYAYQGYEDKYDKPRHGPSGQWHNVYFEDSLPQLSELSIADKTFGADDLLIWGGKEGWTNLKRITLWDDRLLRCFRGSEHSLRSIHLIDARQGYEYALVEMCSRTIKLTELKIQTDISGLPFRALKICGRSLTTLAIHPHKQFSDSWQEMQDISPLFLQAVQHLCPRLTNLASNLRWPPDSMASLQELLEALSKLPRLTEMTLHIQEPGILEKHKSPLAAVEYAFRHLIQNGNTKQKLKRLTLRDGPQPSDWDNPWGAVESSSRIFQATRSTTEGGTEQEINARQIRGPETEPVQHDRQQEREEAERKTRDYLEAVPPVVLSQMIEVTGGQNPATSPGVTDRTYNIQTGGWSPKLAEYEEKWRESSGILPLLEWQLRKRREQGWKLWDMPLMQSDAGNEGFLYDRMAETSAES